MRKILITLSLMLIAMSSNLFAQEITPGKEVDLGLPSGTIWASWNVGATSPEEYGDYFAWGETEEKENYSETSYQYYDNVWQEYIKIGENISGSQYDVARQKWGDEWRMPIEKEWEELLSECTWEWIQYNNSVNGYKITGPNGNRIFLPAAGNRNNTSLYKGGSCGYYWIASLIDDCVSEFGFSNEAFILASLDRPHIGLSIRPVKSK